MYIVQNERSTKNLAPRTLDLTAKSQSRTVFFSMGAFFQAQRNHDKMKRNEEYKDWKHRIKVKTNYALGLPQKPTGCGWVASLTS